MHFNGSDQQSLYEASENLPSMFTTAQHVDKNGRVSSDRLASPVLGTVMKTAQGLRAGRRLLTATILPRCAVPSSSQAGEMRSGRSSLYKARSMWWIPPKDVSLFAFAMQKMDNVVLSEQGTLASF